MVKKLEKIFKALGDQSRLRIINMLSNRPLCVCEITSVLALSQSTVSGHLKTLKEAGLVEDSKDGLWVEYSLCRDDEFTSHLLSAITTTLQDDKKMEDERLKAKQSNREVLCKK